MPGKNKPVAKKHKFVKDGIFYAELNTLLAKELAEDGYGGCEVRVTPTRTEVVILATKTTNVVGQNARRIKELTALVQKRFKFEKGQIMLYAEMVRNKGLSALSQAEAVRYRLFEGLSVRRAAYSVLKFIMDRGAKGVEVTVSGKLRGQRAKSMKFRDGYMIHAGDAVNYYIDYAVKHVHLRQGVIGIKVKIMLPHDPEGIAGPKKDLPDVITIHPPKELTSDTTTGGGGGAGSGVQHDIRTQARYAPNISPPQDTGNAQATDNYRQQQQSSKYQQQPSKYQQQQQQHVQYDQQGGGGQSQQFDQFNQNENTQFQQQQQPPYADYNQYGQGQGQQQNFNQYNSQNQRQDQGNFNAQHGGRGQQQGYYNQNQRQYNQGNQNNRGF